MNVPASAKFEIIREVLQRKDNVLSVGMLCEAANVSRSGYYRYVAAEETREAREKRDQEDFSLILEAFRFRGYAKGARSIYMRLLHELRQSMSRKANCWDNAPQESFFGHMKDEIDISECETFEEIYDVIKSWTEYYNNDRYQWDLAKLSPREYYNYISTGEYPLCIPKAKGAD